MANKIMLDSLQGLSPDDIKKFLRKRFDPLGKKSFTAAKTVGTQLVMDISEQMIGFHLRLVTLAYFGEHDDVPDDVAGYHDYVEDMKRQAIRFGDLDGLKLAFEHILANPEIDTVTLSQANFPYEEEEVREIVRYAWETIWPDANSTVG